MCIYIPRGGPGFLARLCWPEGAVGEHLLLVGTGGLIGPLSPQAWSPWRPCRLQGIHTFVIQDMEVPLPSWSVYSFCPGIIIHVLAYGTAKAACLVLRGKAALKARAPTLPRRSAKELEPGTYALSGINLRDSPLLCQAKLDALWVSPLCLAVSGPAWCTQ